MFARRNSASNQLDDKFTVKVISLLEANYRTNLLQLPSGRPTIRLFNIFEETVILENERFDSTESSVIVGNICKAV